MTIDSLNQEFANALLVEATYTLKNERHWKIMDFTKTDTLPDDYLININGSTDPCYRYKMHPIRVSYVAENGGSTIIDNAAQIAREIYRDLSDLKSCFARELGSRVTVRDDQLIIRGTFDSLKVNDVLHKYIADNVLCEKCDNPETPVWKKHKRKCQACGHQFAI